MDDPAGVSVIVPTRNERDNVAELLRRLAALPARTVDEVVFVDDSDDDTAEAIVVAANGCSFPVQVLHRPPGERGDGLGGAVLGGFARASGEWFCVMDADLQHPPEALVDLVAVARDGATDLVCASRTAPGGDDPGLRSARRLLSHGSTRAARLLFPRRLAGVSDPMSGFFLVRRRSLDLSRLQPSGFKILLEILVRHPSLRRADVSYRFEPRFSGDSKAGVREGLTYLRRLLALRLAPTSAVSGGPAIDRNGLGERVAA